jgi:hypothetical protein
MKIFRAFASAGRTDRPAFSRRLLVARASFLSRREPSRSTRMRRQRARAEALAASLHTIAVGGSECA